jgi:hypothetical protein
MNKQLEFEEEVRDGRIGKCPFCGENIIYTWLVNWDSPVPFFYSNLGNDVALRKSDRRLVDEYLLNGKTSLDELEGLWKKIVDSLPPAPDGGKFELWSNVKCPHCKTEFPYNKGVRDINIRIWEPEIILIDGAVVLDDTFEDSWRVKVRVSL